VPTYLQSRCSGYDVAVSPNHPFKNIIDRQREVLYDKLVSVRECAVGTSGTVTHEFAYASLLEDGRCQAATFAERLGWCIQGLVEGTSPTRQ